MHLDAVYVHACACMHVTHLMTVCGHFSLSALKPFRLIIKLPLYCQEVHNSTKGRRVTVCGRAALLHIETAAEPSRQYHWQRIHSIHHDAEVDDAAEARSDPALNDVE